MATPFGTVGERFATVFSSMSGGQKATMITVVVLGVAAIAGIVHWASAPDMVPLFSNLPPEDAAKIVDWLTENNIDYRLEQNGGRVLVPRKNQYDARIQLAEEGLPSKRSTGYEIFDKTNLGMSEFVQKLNFRRALEGELSRTIESIDQVSEARVHIVIPEPALFREKEKSPTASVAMKVVSQLSESQVAGITHLIASSVEGLDTKDITIIDSQGNVLSDMTESDPMMAMTTTQISLKQKVENDLSRKVDSMLDRLLGPDKSIVRVSVELDFTRSDMTSEVFDPDQTAVRSEELNESSAQTQNDNQVNPVDPAQPPLGQSDTQTQSNTITNYEVSRTVTNTSTQGGGTKRISASVVVDGVYEQVTDENGDQVTQYRDRTQQEMDAIRDAVQGALGYNEDRGDQVSVLNMAFQAPADIMPQPTVLDWLRDNGMDILRNLLLAGAVVGLLVYIRNLMQRTGQVARESWERRLAALPTGRGGQLPGAIGAGEERLALPDIDSELPPEVVEANQLQEQIMDFSVEKPEVAARLLKTWLVDTGGN